MAQSDEAVKFFETVAEDFDVAGPLRWSFQLDGVAEDDVERLMSEVARLGFTEIEPMIDEDHEDKYVLWFADVCVHTADSFAARASTVEEFSARNGLVVGDYAAGLVDDGV